MLRFHRALNHLEVKEIELVEKKFTWSNNQESPTMTRIGRAFCTVEWEGLFANPIAHLLSSSVSDHCPLLLTVLKPRFKFESFWVDREGFHDCVNEAWSRTVAANQNHLSRLHIKLSRTSKALKA
jgi:hypothetical protein